jgi:hypothetical protein
MTADAVLAAPALQPAAPSATGASLSSTAGSGSSTIVGVAAPALAATETVTGATAWVYAATGAGQPLNISLEAGSTSLATTAIGANKPAAWFSVTANGPLTAAQIGHLSIELRSQGSSQSATTVYAAYVELSTSGAQTSGPGSGTGTGGSNGTDATIPLASLPPSLAPAAIAAPSNPVQVSAARTIVVVVRCPAAAITGCHGTITLRLGVRNAQLIAVAARCGRGCRTIGGGSFNVAAGKTKRVKAHMTVSTRSLFGNRKSVVVAEMTTVHTPSGQLLSSTAVVVLKRPARAS